MTRAFIFDFDGVIADTETLWFDTVYRFTQSMRLDTDYPTLTGFVGDGDVGLIAHLNALLGPGRNIDEYLPKLRDDFNAAAAQLHTRPGILAYLDYANETGLLLGIASNSSGAYITRWLRQLGLENRFNAIATPDGGNRLKPAPDIYLAALRGLGVAARDAIAFDDSMIGLAAAQAAHIPAVAFPNALTRNAVLHYRGPIVDLAEIAPDALIAAVNELA